MTETPDSTSAASSIKPGSVVLVTGATGFTGSVLVRKLCARGAVVRAIARHSSDTSPLSDLPVSWHRGDVFDPAVIASAMPGVEYVFHVAAAYREAGISDRTYRDVHVTSTIELARCARAIPELKRFVHVSTVGVHGHIDDPPADEGYRFNPGDIYQRTKAEAEEWLRSFSRESGLEIAVVRPAAIYGPGDKRLLKIFKMSKWRLFPIFGRGKGLYHLVHVNDLTDLIMLAATHPGARGEVFIAGDPRPIELRRMVEVIAAELGNAGIRFVRLPAGPLFAAADICEAVCKPFGVEPPIYRRRVAFFTKDRAFDTSKARNMLGFAASIETEAGLRATASWYREAGWL